MSNSEVNHSLELKNGLDVEKNREKEIVLSCHKLTRTYTQGQHNLTVLSGLDLDVAKGEMIAIVGASGSGKTTLLNLLGGIDNATSGTVILNGKHIDSLSSSEQDALRNSALGFVYQFHHLLGEFTAQENVAMPLVIARHNFDEAMTKAKNLLDKVGMGERAHHKPSELSGGERQRVAIARALVNKPSCVLMDEPTGNLDRHTAEAVQNLLLELNQELELSFVIVTHDHALAKRMNRVLQLEDGVLKETNLEF